MQSYFLTQFVQAFVYVFQRFLNTFQDLLLGRVYVTVKDWKQIILLYLVGVVLVDDFLCLFRKTAVHHLTRLASCQRHLSVLVFHGRYQFQRHCPADLW